MTTRISAATVALLALLGAACDKKEPAPAASPAASSSPSAQAEEQNAMYALGAQLGANLKPFKLSDAQLEHVAAGLRDAAKDAKLKVDPQAYQMQLQQLFMAKQLEAAQVEKARGKTFADAAAKEPGASVLPSGLVYRTLSPGNGPNPKPSDVVKVHYRGTFVDGKEFDSSHKRGQPVEFPLNGVIRCWSEGVQRMKVGEKAQLVCPSDIAYGDQGRGPQMPGGSTLVFEVELLGAKPAPKGGR